MSYRENFKLIDWSAEIVLPSKAVIPLARSDLPCPRIMSDAMSPVQSMLDGKYYDSKSALRATYRAAGVTEVGNDPARLRPRVKKKIDRKEVKTTLEIAQARFNRGERVNRHKIASA